MAKTKNIPADNSRRLELSSVIVKVIKLEEEENHFLALSAKNQFEADLRAFRIGELIWKQVLQEGRGPRGTGRMKKFLDQSGWKKTTAYNYVNIYLGAERSIKRFKRYRLPREYWQILGSTFNDGLLFSESVRAHLTHHALLKNGEPDNDLLKEAGKLFRQHKKKLEWNPPLSETTISKKHVAGVGDVKYYKGTALPEAFLHFIGVRLVWEHDLSLLLGEDRRELTIEGEPLPPLDLSGTPNVSNILHEDRKIKYYLTLRDGYNQRCQDIAEAKKLAKKAETNPTERQRYLAQKSKLEGKYYRIEHGSFQHLKLEGLPVLSGEKPMAIICDPPYTKEYTPNPPKSKNSDFFDHLGEFIQKNLAPKGQAALMLGQAWIQSILEVLFKHDLMLRWILTAEYESGNWAEVDCRHVICCQKPVVVLHRKKEAPTKTIVGDLIHCGQRDKRFFAWQQDVETFEQIVHKLTDPDQLVCDPCAGTGTTGIAALNLGRRFVGCEKNDTAKEPNYSTAVMRLHECFYDGNKWRMEYAKTEKRFMEFDETGGLVNPKTVTVIKEDGVEEEIQA